MWYRDSADNALQKSVRSRKHTVSGEFSNLTKHGRDYVQAGFLETVNPFLSQIRAARRPGWRSATRHIV